MELKYIDISEFQQDIIDIDKLVANCDGVMVRIGFTGYGSLKPTLDARFNQFMEKLSKTSIPVGVYYFSLAYNEDMVRMEVDWVVKQLRIWEDKGYRFKLPIAIDSETQNNCKPLMALTAERRSILVDYWCKRLEYNGYYPIIYAGVRGYHRQPYWLIKDMLIEWDKWTAQYYKECQWDGVAGVNYHIWQYASDGKGSEYGLASKCVDLNKSYIDYAQRIWQYSYNHIEETNTDTTKQVKVTLGNDVITLPADTVIKIEYV